MRDEKYTPEVGTWLKGREAASPDSQDAARRVATRLPHVRQRSRWWPFPIFYRRTQTRTTTDTDDYQPSPIPASNGHTPTVSGRTQTMFSPVKAIAAGALVFAIGGVLLVAQPFQQQTSVPGAATDIGPVAAYVHGTLAEGTCCGAEVETHDADGNRLTVRNSENTSTLTLDDPRLTGTWFEVQQADEFAQQDTDERVELWWGDVRIQNAGGAWSGTKTSTYDSAQPTETDMFVVELTGEGDYAGLSALLFPAGVWTYTGGTSTIDMAGAIFPGELPPDR